MTNDEIIICSHFSHVTFLPGSFDKRFANNLCALANSNPDKELSEKQKEWCYRLLYKYRRQIPNVYEKYKTHPHCKKKETTNEH